MKRAERQTSGKFQKPGIEQKIAETHIQALNGALAAGMNSGMAHAMGDMAVREMMSPDQKSGGGKSRKVGIVIIGPPR